MLLSSSSESPTASLKRWYPRLVWSQVLESYPRLVKLLMDVYRAPASTRGMERHSKVGKRVQSSIHGGTDEELVERKVAICHNDRQLDQEVSFKGYSFEMFLAECSHAKAGSAGDACDISCDRQDGEPDASDVLRGEELRDEEMLSLEAAIASEVGPLSIGDKKIFESDP